MRLMVRHKINWEYSEEVFLFPHLFRLIPRSGGDQVMVQHHFNIEPLPAGVSRVWDAHNNLTEYAWFSGKHHRLDIEISSVVETYRSNPYDAIAPRDGAWDIPMRYPQDEQLSLMPYRVAPAANDELDEIAASLDRSDAQAFAADACRWLNENITYGRREEGDPMPPSALLKFKEGSCRDLAVTHADLCRRVGIASRFVSGYHCVEADITDLHAWSEVFLPGAGWRGFDATTGLAAAGEHIAVAAAAQPSGAAPSEGSFSGDATADLNFKVEFQIV